MDSWAQTHMHARIDARTQRNTQAFRELLRRFPDADLPSEIESALADLAEEQAARARTVAEGWCVSVCALA